MPGRGLLEEVRAGLPLSREDLELSKTIAGALSPMTGGSIADGVAREAESRYGSAVVRVVRRAVERAGARVYSSYSFKARGLGAGVVKAVAPWGRPPWRLILGAAALRRVSGRVRGRYSVEALELYYMALPERFEGRLDRLLPRVKRKTVGHGYRILIDPSGASRCWRVVASIEEYKAKYIVFIPPIIAWKFGKYVSPAVLESEECVG